MPDRFHRAELECALLRRRRRAPPGGPRAGGGSAAEGRSELMVRRDRVCVHLLGPVFNKCDLNPGYIKGYLPGVRENGGQYTHAAIWATMAFARLGDHQRAWELFALINPVNHAKSAAAVT